MRGRAPFLARALTLFALFGCLPVCIKVINDIKEAAGSEKNLEKIEGVLQRVCAGVTTTQEKKLVRSFDLPRGMRLAASG